MSVCVYIPSYFCKYWGSDHSVENGHALQNIRGICSWVGLSSLWMLCPERLTKLGKRGAKLGFTTLRTSRFQPRETLTDGFGLAWWSSLKQWIFGHLKHFQSGLHTEKRARVRSAALLTWELWSQRGVCTATALNPLSTPLWISWNSCLSVGMGHCLHIFTANAWESWVFVHPVLTYC